MRKSKEELNALCKKYNVDRLWSWSKINTYIQSPYEYYLKYIAYVKEDRNDCVYAPLGGICHSIIEDYYSGKISYEEMRDMFDDGWTTTIDIADLKFDRNDSVKNERIGNKYKYDLEHFFSNHVPFTKKMELERFVTANINGNILQGYIDAVYSDDDGFINILDWKTSTRYSAKDMQTKAGQLTVYAIALHQLGLPFEMIKIGFNFLKYVKVEYQLANGKTAIREIERYEIGNKLSSNVKMWLKKLGYENEMDAYLSDLINNNSISSLPQDIKSKYVFKDCIVYVDLTKELLKYWYDKISKTIEEIEIKEEEYELLKVTDIEKAEKLFFDDPVMVEKESYYFATLCGYSANLHKPYKLYLDKLEAKKNQNDLLSGVGSALEDSDDDMSWLDNI